MTQSREYNQQYLKELAMRAFAKVVCDDGWEIDSEATPYHFTKEVETFFAEEDIKEFDNDLKELVYKKKKVEKLRETGRLIMSMPFVVYQNKNNKNEKKTDFLHNEMIFIEKEIKSITHQPMQKITLKEENELCNKGSLDQFLKEWARAPIKEEWFGETASVTDFCKKYYPDLQIESNFGSTLSQQENVEKNLKEYFSEKLQISIDDPAQQLSKFINLDNTSAPFSNKIGKFIFSKAAEYGAAIQMDTPSSFLKISLNNKEGITSFNFEYSFKEMNYVDLELNNIVKQGDETSGKIPFPCTISFIGKIQKDQEGNDQLIIEPTIAVSNPAIALILSNEANDLNLEEILNIGQSNIIEDLNHAKKLGRSIARNVIKLIMKDQADLKDEILKFIKNLNEIENKKYAIEEFNKTLKEYGILLDLNSENWLNLNLDYPEDWNTIPNIEENTKSLIKFNIAKKELEKEYLSSPDEFKSESLQQTVGGILTNIVAGAKNNPPAVIPTLTEHLNNTTHYLRYKKEVLKGSIKEIPHKPDLRVTKFNETTKHLKNHASAPLKAVGAASAALGGALVVAKLLMLKGLILSASGIGTPVGIAMLAGGAFLLAAGSLMGLVAYRHDQSTLFSHSKKLDKKTDKEISKKRFAPLKK